MIGTIRTVKLDRNFAFIEPQEPGPDVFAHSDKFDPEMVWDETLKMRRVEFDVEDSPRGPRAINVRPATHKGA